MKELLLFVCRCHAEFQTYRLRETPCLSHLGSKLGGHLKAWQYHLGDLVCARWAVVSEECRLNVRDVC